MFLSCGSSSFLLLCRGKRGRKEPCNGGITPGRGRAGCQTGRVHPQRAAGAKALKLSCWMGNGEDWLRKKYKKSSFFKTCYYCTEHILMYFHQGIKQPQYVLCVSRQFKNAQAPRPRVPEPICCQETQNWYHGGIKPPLEMYETANDLVFGVWLSQQDVKEEKLTFC